MPCMVNIIQIGVGAKPLGLEVVGSSLSVPLDGFIKHGSIEAICGVRCLGQFFMETS